MSLLSERIATALSDRRTQGLERQLRLCDPTAEGLNLASNDYLGLSFHPEVRAAACAAVEAWGCSASASPLVTGFGPAQGALVAEIEDWYPGTHALLWTSGYAANEGVLALFPRAGDLVLADRLIHHSLIAGIMGSSARMMRFRHNDLDHLEALLAEHAGRYAHVYVVTESVYSMDGDLADVRGIAQLKERYTFVWMLDEAHAVGWYGPGWAHSCGVGSAVDILVGTLGKALAGQGAYTLFRQATWRDFCIQFAPSWMYSTYLSPASAASAQAAIRLVRARPDRSTQAQADSRALRARLGEAGWTVPAGDSPILPLYLPEGIDVVAFAGRLRERGIWVGAMRPPTVPPGTARLRISLRAERSPADLDRLCEALAQARLEEGW